MNKYNTFYFEQELKSLGFQDGDGCCCDNVRSRAGSSWVKEKESKLSFLSYYHRSTQSRNQATS